MSELASLGFRGARLIWRETLIGFVAFLVGVVDMLFHRASWNSPVHWTSMGVFFVFFPVTTFVVTALSKTYSRAAGRSAALAVGYFLGAEWIWIRQHKSFWDDLLIVFPLVLGYFIGAVALIAIFGRLRRNASHVEPAEPFLDNDDYQNPYQSPKTR